MTSSEPTYPPIVKRLAIIRVVGGAALLVIAWFGGTGVRERAMVGGLGLLLLAPGLLTLREVRAGRPPRPMQGDMQRRDD